jgi:glycine cleavage system aminomethyltransferase T
LVVSRTGWSSELGYEIYLRDGSKGDELWEKIMAAGQAHGLKPGHTSSIRRIEGAMLSYHADADINTNPYEVGLGRLVDLEMDESFVGKEALKKIYQTGVSRQLIGIEFDGDPLTGPNTTFWQISAGDQIVGKVTSAVYSPRLKKNIALAMVSTSHTDIGTALVIDTKAGIRNGVVCEKPFFDPKKKIASA